MHLEPPNALSDVAPVQWGGLHLSWRVLVGKPNLEASELPMTQSPNMLSFVCHHPGADWL